MDSHASLTSDGQPSLLQDGFNAGYIGIYEQRGFDKLTPRLIRGCRQASVE